MSVFTSSACFVLVEAGFVRVANTVWAADLESEGVVEGIGQVVLAAFEYEVLRGT